MSTKESKPAEKERLAYELRTLTSQDIFPICGILRKIGIKEIKGIFSSSEIADLVKGGKPDASAIGMSIAFDMAGLLISNLPACENEVYAFASSVSGIRKEELRAMPMADFLELVIAIIKKDEFRDFFSVAQRSLR